MDALLIATKLSVALDPKRASRTAVVRASDSVFFSLTIARTDRKRLPPGAWKLRCVSGNTNIGEPDMGHKPTTPQRQLAKAMVRLAKSQTVLTRGRARSNLTKVLTKIENELLAAYPAIRMDGSAVRPRKPKGCRCPLCDVPMRSTSTLAKHLAGHHKWMKFTGVETIITCLCGKSMCAIGTGPQSMKLARNGLTYHLRKVPNLRDHFTLGALQQI